MHSLMVGKEEETVEKIIKKQIVKTSIELEEYIPLKVLIERKDEPIKNLLYLKDKTSVLEISVGITSELIKRIILLLSKEYDINNSKLNIDVYDMGDIKVNDEVKNSCSYFKTHLYEDGIRIVISEEKVSKYVKMDRLYVGLSNLGSIIEICLCQLAPNEVNHIRKELDYQ